MEIQTKNVNITIIYTDEVISITQNKIGDIRNKIIEIWDKQPVITQFPDMVAVIEPESQFSCIVQQGRKVIMSDQNINEFAARSLDGFYKFVGKYNEIIKQNIKCFGFNFVYVSDFSNNKTRLIKEQKKSKDLINLKEIAVKQKDLIGFGVNISYKTNIGKITISSSPKYDEDVTEMIGLDILTNVQFNINTIPSFSELKDIFEKQHSLMLDKVNEIFNVS